MDWLSGGSDAGLWGLFVGSFLAATLLPGGSEVLLFALLRQHPQTVWLALALATLGNTLGGMSSYACGRWLPQARRFEAWPWHGRLQRWGSPVLLLAWAPLLGDALCVAAGWLRINWAGCALFMALGKAARYALVAQGALW
jgi:membrane protein YqaA with SNARE-associated domain